MNWPEGKKFAFTIIDDTDNSYIHNIKPVYDLLQDLEMKTTKTVWVYPPRDHFEGACLQDKDYLEYILNLKEKGFEIGLHNVGSGSFTREEIKKGLEDFKNLLGAYPNMHINHSRNPDNLYWGFKRFTSPLSAFMKQMKSRRIFEGEEEDSPHFWGDLAKKHITYMRNHVFNRINTLSADPYMPYRNPKKDRYSNLWFSSSDGHTVEEFNRLIKPDNINRLEKEDGCCIVYTHFASGFTDHDGNLDPVFKKRMEYLAEKQGWFVPASDLLDHLRSKNGREKSRVSSLRKTDLKWLTERIKKKMISGR